jgi:hypothetical protein
MDSIRSSDLVLLEWKIDSTQSAFIIVWMARTISAVIGHLQYHSAHSLITYSGYLIVHIYIITSGFTYSIKCI